MLKFPCLLVGMFLAGCASTDMQTPPVAPARTTPVVPVVATRMQPQPEHAFNMPVTNPHGQAVRLQRDDVLSFAFTCDRDARVQVRLQVIDVVTGLMLTDWTSLVLLRTDGSTEVVIPVLNELDIAPGERRILEVRTRLLHQFPRETLRLRFQPQAVTYSRPDGQQEQGGEATPSRSRDQLREF